jgi:hypothetical protein
MICPNCRSEYRPGFTLCSDCGVELVDELPEEAQVAPRDISVGDPSEMVEVYRAWGRARADLIRSVLEGNGIQTALFGEGRNAAYNFTIGSMAEIRVMVAADDLDAARAVLDAADRGELELDEEP